MYAILEHEDVVKSRKALMTASFILLILTIFEIADGKINLVGLNIKFDRNASLGLTSLFVLYFMIIFIIRCFEFRIPQTLKKSAEKIKNNIQEEIRNVNGAEEYYDQSSRDFYLRTLEEKLKFIDNNYIQKAEKIKLFIYLVADVLPPIAIALFALSRVDLLLALKSLIQSGVQKMNMVSAIAYA